MAEITFTSPALHVELSKAGVYRITREGKGDYLEFSRRQLIRHGWAPVTGSSLRGQVTISWDWGHNDLAQFTDHRGWRSTLAGISAVVEEMAFLYIS